MLDIPYTDARTYLLEEGYKEQSAKNYGLDNFINYYAADYKYYIFQNNKGTLKIATDADSKYIVGMKYEMK